MYRQDILEAQELEASTKKKRGPRERVERQRLVYNCFMVLEALGLHPASHAHGNVAALAEAIHELATGRPHKKGWADLAKDTCAGLRASLRLLEFVKDRATADPPCPATWGDFAAEEKERDASRRKNFKKLNSPK